MAGKYGNKGYTLLEIILVLLLLAGAGYLLLIRIPVQESARNLEMAAHQLLDDLRVAQQAAVTESARYWVRFYPYGNQYRISTETGLVRSVKLPQGVRFGNDPNELSFTGAGIPSAGMTIRLTDGKTSRHVIVAPVMGRIRLE